MIEAAAPPLSAPTPRPPLWRDAAILLAVALVLRCAAFGDPNIDPDETFYWLVAQRMHEGLVPYVDVWDRKPLGLFLLYWAISALWANVLAYQLAATAFAAATATVITRLARRWIAGLAPLLAGAAYLAMLHPLIGMGGQSPVFYNLLIVGAAALLVEGWTGPAQALERRWVAAMVLCGLALTIKQTTVWEGAFFGLAGLWRLRALGRGPARLAVLALAGAGLAVLPTAAIAAWYWAHGYWPEWWNAFFTSNLKRTGVGELAVKHNLYAILRLMAVHAGIAALGLARAWSMPSLRPWRGLLVGWLAAAVAGFFVLPNYFAHYALPLLAPLGLFTAFAFARRPLGPVLFAATFAIAVIFGRPFDFAHHRQSKAAFARMTAEIERWRDGRALLIFHGGPLLFEAAHAPFATPLVFPEHLLNPLERNVSHIDTRAEVLRVLATRPGVIIMPNTVGVRGDDGLLDIVDAYLAANCTRAYVGPDYEPRGVVRTDFLYACRR
ncbi:ArnT family glycosyltransferase [Parablastomonas sp. CN1-191]|uniref:ArnT family glycosyltransferase n=1 Tax=Parablastomonas sp. CN1-191 TaxID=3400908 RepID=UPI003BF8BF78